MRYLLFISMLAMAISCERSPDAPEALNDWFYNQRAYPSGKINNQLFHAERQSVLRDRRLALRDEDEWQLEGPLNVGGRITDVEMPHNSMEEIWIGSASGGAFKSTDRGLTWEEVTEEWGSPPVGDIAIRQSNPQEVWVGTGESNGGSGSIAYEGFGILRTRNGGRTWENMGLPNSGSISRIALDPTDPYTIYVAAMGYLFEENSQRGIFRSRDGGQTWANVLYLGPTSGGSDIIIDPNDPDVLYASIWERLKFPGHKTYWGPTSGIYKSIDGGNNWSELDLGFSTDSLGRIGLAMAPSNNLRLYALVTGIDGEYEGFCTTSDGGRTWQHSDADLWGNYRTAGYWYCNVTVDPDDMDRAFLCGLDAIKTEDAGRTFEPICDMHVDQHSIFLHPMDPEFGLIGNDGGLYLSNTKFENCIKYQNLPITQFYTCSLDPIDSTVMYGGTQDNNPLIRRTGQSDWRRMLGGDGFVTLADPRNNDIIYTEYQYGNLFKSTDGGRDWDRITEGMDRTRSNWNSPFMFEPGNPDVLYFGSHRMHKTEDGGESWSIISDDLSNGPGGNLVYGTISSLDVHPEDVDIIIAGTDDGNVWITENGGADWILVSDSLPARWVTRVVCDPHQVGRFYVTFSGLKWNESFSHIYRTDDFGVNWEDIGQGLPEVPVNDLIVDPEDSRRYWIATDLGVFESLDAGETWYSLGQNMPVAIVNDLDFRNDTRILLAATYGRSMYSIHLPLILTDNYGVADHTEARLYHNGQSLVLSGMEGDMDLEVFSVSGQFLYSEHAEILPGRSHQLDYRIPQGLRTFIVVARDRETGDTRAFKTVN